MKRVETVRLRPKTLIGMNLVRDHGRTWRVVATDSEGMRIASLDYTGGHPSTTRHLRWMSDAHFDWEMIA